MVDAATAVEPTLLAEQQGLREGARRRRGRGRGREEGRRRRRRRRGNSSAAASVALLRRRPREKATAAVGFRLLAASVVVVVVVVCCEQGQGRLGGKVGVLLQALEGHESELRVGEGRHEALQEARRLEGVAQGQPDQRRVGSLGREGLFQGDADTATTRTTALPKASRRSSSQRRMVLLQRRHRPRASIIASTEALSDASFRKARTVDRPASTSPTTWKMGLRESICSRCTSRADVR